MLPTIFLSLTAAAPSAPAAPTFDALDQVNAQRAARGLAPFVRDENLMFAARQCASFRAARLLFGHTANDFQFLPPGASADAAGCAAYSDSYGFMACATYENYTYAGAASVRGADGRLYHHLFVRGKGNFSPPNGTFVYRERIVLRGRQRHVVYEAAPAPPAIPQPMPPVKPVAGPVPTVIVGSGGCANGRCPAQPTVTRERLFFRSR